MAGQKTDRIVFGAQPDVGVFQRDKVVAFGKKMLEQGGFAGLAGAGNDNCRERPQGLADGFFQGSFLHPA